jgi:hypothetical protein
MIITVFDLPAAIQSAESVEMLVAGANAKASRVAPCLADTTTPPSEDQLAEAKLVLVGAVKRWIEAGAGSLQSQQAGPFGVTVDTRQRTGYNLWPSEIEALQQICSTGTGREAFSLDTVGTSSLAGHAPYCDLYFGGTTCSCGYSLTGVSPIYEPY